MLIVLPSPAAVSPLLMSFSTGPQPLVAETHGMSLTATVPVGGCGTTWTMPRVVLTATFPLLPKAKVAVIVTGYVPGCADGGEASDQFVANDLFDATRLLVQALVAVSVHPSG